jgi:hypothetical protein
MALRAVGSGINVMKGKNLIQNLFGNIALKGYLHDAYILMAITVSIIQKKIKFLQSVDPK